jgi:hypothetical protein
MGDTRAQAIRITGAGRRTEGTKNTATVLNGLAVQVVSGATETELRLVSALALQAWPS